MYYPIPVHGLWKRHYCGRPFPSPTLLMYTPFQFKSRQPATLGVAGHAEPWWWLLELLDQQLSRRHLLNLYHRLRWPLFLFLPTLLAQVLDILPEIARHHVAHMVLSDPHRLLERWRFLLFKWITRTSLSSWSLPTGQTIHSATTCGDTSAATLARTAIQSCQLRKWTLFELMLITLAAFWVRYMIWNLLWSTKRATWPRLSLLEFVSPFLVSCSWYLYSFSRLTCIDMTEINTAVDLCSMFARHILYMPQYRLGSGTV